MNLCLGTVQFGMDYGIRGQKRPLLSDAIAMLNYAEQNGIATFDTASAYGDAETVIGAWLKTDNTVRKRIHLISKLTPNLLDNIRYERYYFMMKEDLENSLFRLGTDYLDAYLLHSSRYVYDDLIIEMLLRLKKEGYVRKIGVSVYEADEARRGILCQDIDMLQLPSSIFDQRMFRSGIFALAREHDFILHSRSAFIQGLILMEEDELPDFLSKARPILRKIDTLCRDTGLTRIELAMGYVKQQDAISHLVFGVDNLEQLKEDIVSFRRNISADIMIEASTHFANLDADIVMPSLWKK